jgi:hypothetical protein
MVTVKKAHPVATKGSKCGCTGERGSRWQGHCSGPFQSGFCEAAQNPPLHGQALALGTGASSSRGLPTAALWGPPLPLPFFPDEADVLRDGEGACRCPPGAPSGCAPHPCREAPCNLPRLAIPGGGVGAGAGLQGGRGAACRGHVVFILAVHLPRPCAPCWGQTHGRRTHRPLPLPLPQAPLPC